MHARTVIPAAVAALLLVAAPLIPASPASAADGFAFTVIGDAPYGDAQFAAFDSFSDQINADPALQLVSHIGDISSPLNCSDDYYSTIKGKFDRFADPFVYTPGDNEWADCTRATTGAADPLNRLAAVRATFFPTPGRTLGASPLNVNAQSSYPENVRFDEGGLTFASVHLVGSNNDLNTWSGYTSRTSAQSAEVTARTNADITHIHDAFAQAKASGSRALVLLTQADMFYSGWTSTNYKTAFQPIVQALAADSAGFQKPVFLINGDTHSYVNDKPLTSSTWLSYYGVPSSVPNLTRVTIRGGTSEYARFSVVSTSAVLTVTRVPYQAVSNAVPTASISATTSGLSTNVDGSASTDPDGSIASYAWNFGDGGTASGATASHTYAQAGSYTITLTVTDNGGATGTASRSVSVSSTTPPPTSGSGVITTGSSWSYWYGTSAPASGWRSPGFDDSSWKTGAAPMGWGTTDIATALTAAAPLPLTSYHRKTVTLSDSQAAAPLSLSVRSDDGVVVYLNGSEVGRHNMPTGTVTDGTYATAAVSATAAVATPVSLTVPSSLLVAGSNVVAVEVHSNYHGAASHSFELSASSSGDAVTDPAPPTDPTPTDPTPTDPTPTTDAFAQDSFTRSVTGGLGTADTGGAWTISGAASSFEVTGGAGTLTLPRTHNLFAYLGDVSSDDTDLTTGISFSRPTASSVYTGVIGRKVGSDSYGARAVVNSAGRVLLQLQRDTDTILGSATVSGLTFGATDSLQLRVRVTGTSPTTVQAKAWRTGTTEPASWPLTATDTTAALQAPGSIGLYAYLSTSATPTTIPVAFDNLVATPTA